MHEQIALRHLVKGDLKISFLNKRLIVVHLNVEIVDFKLRLQVHEHFLNAGVFDYGVFYLNREVRLAKVLVNVEGIFRLFNERKVKAFDL